MKPLFCLLLSVFCFAAFAQPVKFMWDIVPDTNVLGYRLLTGPTSGVFTRTNTVIGRMNNTVTVTNAGSGRAFSVAVAFSDFGDSDWSNEVSWTNKVAAPKNLQVSALIQASANITGPWTNLASVVVPLPPTTEQGFFRSRLLLEELQ